MGEWRSYVVVSTFFLVSNLGCPVAVRLAKCMVFFCDLNFARIQGLVLSSWFLRLNLDVSKQNNECIGLLCTIMEISFPIPPVKVDVIL